MQTILLLLTSAIVLIGSVFSLLAAVGLLRLPDVFSRMHAASKAGTVGSGLLLVALALDAMEGAMIARAFAGVVFLLLTAPISAHLLAKAAYAAGYTLSDQTVLNEMPPRDVEKREADPVN